MLPGKLCIGILEEDNPLKSYFRLKPLLVEYEGKYVVFDGKETYPEEGCIRIVPDKNESSHFKARMRRMGRYCVLDLREHAGENDKIRPNKNYHGDETEKNAHIVYSDVVREPAENMIFEILPADAAPGEWAGEAPGTSRLVRTGDNQIWTYTPASDEGAQGQIAPDDLSIPAEEMQRFEIPGFPGQTLAFAIRLPGAISAFLSRVPDGALGIGTGILSGFMLSARLPKLKEKLTQRLPEKVKTHLLPALKRSKNALLGWLKAQLKLSAITYCIIVVGFLLLQIPYAPLWAIAVAAVDAVPLLGTGTILVPWALICLVQRQHLRSIGLLCIYGVSFLTRTILEPRLVGRHLGLDPLVTLVFLYLGYRFWGIVGMLLAPMLVAAITAAQTPSCTDNL